MRGLVHGMFAAVILLVYLGLVATKTEIFTSTDKRVLPPNARQLGYGSPTFWGPAFFGGK